MNANEVSISSPLFTESPPLDPPDKPTSLGDEQDSVPTDDKPKSSSD